MTCVNQMCPETVDIDIIIAELLKVRGVLSGSSVRLLEVEIHALCYYLLLRGDYASIVVNRVLCRRASPETLDFIRWYTKLFVNFH